MCGKNINLIQLLRKYSEFQSKPKKKALLESSEVSSSYSLQSSEEIQPNETSEKPSGSGIAPGPSSEEDSTLNSYGPYIIFSIFLALSLFSGLYIASLQSSFRPLSE